MQRAHHRSYLIVGTALVLAAGIGIYFYATRYEGDGVYVVEGLFPLKDYELTFPEFRLDVPGEYLWHFRGFCSTNERIFVNLHAHASEDVPWWTVSTRVEVVIQDHNGDVVFEKRSPLNSFTVRTASGDVFPDHISREWETEYFVKTDMGEAQSPVAIDGAPKRGTNYYGWARSLSCTHSYNVLARVADVFPMGGRPIRAELSISSGWK